jgi:hypothetical protein
MRCTQRSGPESLLSHACVANMLLLCCYSLCAAFACIYALYKGVPHIIGMAVTASPVILCCIAMFHRSFL